MMYCPACGAKLTTMNNTMGGSRCDDCTPNVRYSTYKPAYCHGCGKASTRYFCKACTQRSSVPAELGPLVKMIDHSNGESVEYDEIERMVSGPVIPSDYARRIAYREQQEPVQDDPFDLFETISVQREIAPDELAIRSENYNKLLSWLSAVGSGTWQAF